MDTSSILQLADTIKENASLLHDYLVENDRPNPSLGVDGASLSISHHERDTLNARETLWSATRELQNLILGPIGILFNIGANEVLCLQIINRYKIASAFGIHEQPTFEQVSESCGLNVRDLRRILRYAMTNHIFCEPRPGIVAHTAASRLLAENPLTQDFIGNVCEVRFPASARTADALDKYGQSQDANQSGFSLCNNTARGLYDEISHDTKTARRWEGAMSAMATQIDLDLILNSFAWTLFTEPTVLDIGGGRGDVSFGLAKRLPSARFIVQDVSETTREEGNRIAAASNARVTFQAYDFRSPQPVRDADIYYFRNIFHNWPDATCMEILRNQIPSLKQGARLVIDDFALHEPGTLSASEERKQRWMDINMLIFFGSRERTVEEWRELLTEADPGFKLLGAKTVAHQPNTILEVLWVGGCEGQQVSGGGEAMRGERTEFRTEFLAN